MSSKSSSASIERWDTTHPRWSTLMDLPGVQDLDLESKTQEWHLGTHTLVAEDDEEIIGVLRFWIQLIGIDEDKPPLLANGEQAIEAKVVTFHVVESHRRHGIGRRLQIAAVEWARELGCYQLRSRSPYSSRENHLLKASLGFGISPGRNRPDGAEDTAFFVLPLHLDPELLARPRV